MTNAEIADAGAQAIATLAAELGPDRFEVVMVILDLEIPGNFVTASTDRELTRAVLEAALAGEGRRPEQSLKRTIVVRE